MEDGDGDATVPVGIDLPQNTAQVNVQRPESDASASVLSTVSPHEAVASAAAASDHDGRDEIISLMQAQIDIQSDRITKHEAMIQDLISQVQDLKLALSSEKSKATTASTEPDWTSSRANQESSLSIAEMVKATAEKTIAQSGFVYDENSGLYYDQTSGLYYDSSRSLYYNGHTRTYYTIDPETQQYVFDSQLPPLESSKPKKRSKKLNEKALGDVVSKPKSEEVKSENEAKSSDKVNFKIKGPPDADIEDGELSSSSSVSIIEQDSASDSDASHGTVVLDDDEEEDWDADAVSTSATSEHAPCIRAIVLESTLPELKKGFLFLVTCTGGTIGREGSDHSILIPDPMISKNHAKITYDFEEITITETDNQDSTNNPPQKCYLISDLASMNGTYLNGHRLSPPLIYSDPSAISHGSILRVGGTRMLLHIHPGQLTCGHCEPGLIVVKEPMYARTGNNHTEAKRKKELKKLRRKYGIQGNQTSRMPNSLEYQDRAGERRRTHGSDNPYEKTEVASIHEAITEDNKGFKMMSKMGWSSGDSLGQTKDGIREPRVRDYLSCDLRLGARVDILTSNCGCSYQVKFQVRHGRAGLGAEVPSAVPRQTSTFREKYRTDVLQKTIRRYISPQQQPATQTIGASSSSLPATTTAKSKPSESDIIEID